MPKPPSSKVLSIQQAAQWARAAHRRGLRIVATNGCFDLLHFGHVQYLQRAAGLGDRLVVGLNSDRSVRRLKGPQRPLVPQKQRAGILAALACVDAVVIFPQTRAARFLEAVRPEIYVKGGDYRLSTLDAQERELLAKLKTGIRILPLVRGLSTTRLLEKIKQG